jgi:SAM-dependent methyltransferase
MITGRMIALAQSRPALHKRLKQLAHAVGYDVTDWVRVVMYQKCFEFLRTLGPDQLDVLEISAGPLWRQALKFRSYTGTHYPEFDICKDTLPQKFDVIIADQVFEHLKFPARAARNVFMMLKEGGYFVIATPFLLRVHDSPIDCTRWTKDGLFYFLQEAGFPADSIETDSWGNRACLTSNLNDWRKRGFFRSLANEPNFPVMVWGFARKPIELQEPRVPDRRGS